jgi:hypothetical protein
MTTLTARFRYAPTRFVVPWDIEDVRRAVHGTLHFTIHCFHNATDAVPAGPGDTYEGHADTTRYSLRGFCNSEWSERADGSIQLTIRGCGYCFGPEFNDPSEHKAVHDLGPVWIISLRGAGSGTVVTARRCGAEWVAGRYDEWVEDMGRMWPGSRVK